jgi:hypothetical protein
MDSCRACKNRPGAIACPCGKYLYCSIDCSTNDEHLKACQPDKLEFGYYVSVLHALLPIMESLKNDPELYETCKDLAKKLVRRLAT